VAKPNETRNSGARPPRGRCWRVAIACGVGLLLAAAAHGQLAITEVMSSEATNLGPILVTAKSDFWELTNFGSNTVALTNFTFADLDITKRTSVPFTNLFIGPGESIIFWQTNSISTRQDFLNWWGASNVPPGLTVRMYGKPGFDSDSDAVQLFDGNTNLVDHVEFGSAFRGHSFVYDPQTAEFGGYSDLFANGAFKAVQTDDVGSPGITTGPVPLSVVEEPKDVFIDAGLDAEFSVRAVALPRPSYQWFSNNAAISGARNSTLTISNVQLNYAAQYKARLSNGVVTVFTAPATLTVNTNPSPAVIVVPPRDAILFEDQTVTFSVKARGLPRPTYQWKTNGVNVPNATNSYFVVPRATFAMNGWTFTVRVQNTNGSDTASARLFVTPPPLLAITEIMASATTGHADWFELTNWDTNAVDLTRYRFSDRQDTFLLSHTITNQLIIEPGESIIFVEQMTPAEFIAWWGADQLRTGLKITTYRGFGLSGFGDEIYFWNSAETFPGNYFIAVGFAATTNGISDRVEYLEYPVDYEFLRSVPGMNGAFRAASGGDIGSPGYVTNPPARILSITTTNSGYLLKCRVIEGKSYALEAKTELADASWTTVANYSAQTTVITIPVSANPISAFFQLREIP
jgi:hypothetical protein